MKTLLIVIGILLGIVCTIVVGGFLITAALGHRSSYRGLQIPGGDDGYIQGYVYATTKEKLENAVMKVINEDSNIHRDLLNYGILTTNGKSDTLKNQDNDGKYKVTIKIKTSKEEFEYTIEYYGYGEFWKTSSTSEFFIYKAYYKTGKGRSEGGTDLGDELKKKLTDFFEAEFVSKIDKELNLTHTKTK
jgi:hypothetical protein